jgi:hypothetical protein
LLFSVDFPADRGLEDLTPGDEASQQSQAPGLGVGVGRPGSGDEEQVTFNVLQNVTIAAIVGGQTSTGGQADAPAAILLTISPQDALLVKYAKDKDGIVDIVLRAPGAEQPFDVEPVDVDYMINRYRIPTEVGR